MKVNSLNTKLLNTQIKSNVYDAKAAIKCEAIKSSSVEKPEDGLMMLISKYKNGHKYIHDVLWCIRGF